MMENVLSFLRAAAPWISMGLLIAFLCVRPAIRKGKAEDDHAEEGMCVGMCLGLMLGSLSDSSNSGLGASLGMLFGLVIGLCIQPRHQKSAGSCHIAQPAVFHLSRRACPPSVTLSESPHAHRLLLWCSYGL